MFGLGVQVVALVLVAPCHDIVAFAAIVEGTEGGSRDTGEESILQEHHTA